MEPKNGGYTDRELDRQLAKMKAEELTFDD